MSKEFKINAGGKSVFGKILISIFCWYVCYGVYYKVYIYREKWGLFQSAFEIILFTCFGLYFSMLTYKFWKNNQITILNNELIISLHDNHTGRLWPKYIKNTLSTDDIVSAKLTRIAENRLQPCLIIEIKNNCIFHIDTKPFSKNGFRKLLNKMRSIGINVIIEEGVI